MGRLRLIPMNTHPSLYAEIVASGIQHDNHESDLYFPATEKSREILKRWPISSKNAETFRNQRPPNVGELWFDVPFAYLPYWEAKQKGVKGKETALASILNA